MKICVIQTRVGIGDLCIFLPYIQFIAKYKRSKITLITKARTQAKEILKYDPYINCIEYIDEKKNKNFFLYKFLKKKKFNEIYIMHFSFKFFIFSFLSGINKIYYYGFFKNKESITKFINKKIKSWLKIKEIKYKCRIYEKKNNKNNKNNIVIGIGGSGLNKKWPVINYVKLISHLNKIFKNSKFIIAGGFDEKKDANFIRKSLHKKIKLLSLCNKTINDSIRHISNSKFYVGNDTGFMHLCASLRTFSFGLFGDTPINYASYNNLIKPIMPKGRKFITHNDKAMNKIKVNHVINEIQKCVQLIK